MTHASASLGTSSNVVVAVLAILTFVALASATLAFARANFAKAQIDALRGDRDDLLTRVAILEKENLKQTADLLVEQNKVKALEKIVTGKEELERIEHQLAEHDRVSREKADLILRRIGESRG